MREIEQTMEKPRNVNAKKNKKNDEIWHVCSKLMHFFCKNKHGGSKSDYPRILLYFAKFVADRSIGFNCIE